jgi:MFS family permease
VTAGSGGDRRGGDSPGAVRSLVPARLDRLPWSRFHTRLVVALGVAWVLDGLEITLASLIGGALQHRATLALSSEEVGLAASVYLIGEVVGALVFGYLADRFGRRRLLIATLGLYLAASGLTAFSVGRASFLFFRFFAGAGIGGEYAAINSAIDELIPALYRGRVDLAVNGTYWLGALLGAAGGALALHPEILPIDLGWRVALLLGPALGIAIWGMRRALPESPRWQLTHGRAEEAERTIAAIERQVEEAGGALAPLTGARAIELRPRRPLGYLTLGRVLFRTYPERSLLSAALMCTQSFLYNAIFFTYALVLIHFYGVEAHRTALYFFPFATGNLLGPLVLGRFFDTVGRRRMIAGTYLSAGMLLAATGALFEIGALGALTQTLLWCAIFFLASAAASSAYLTVSEIFPLEIRAQAISFFFAVAQVVGATGPWIFGRLIGDEASPDPTGLFYGYLFGAGMMMLGGAVEALVGVDAERASLEEVAPPLTAARDAAAAEPAPARGEGSARRE